MLRFDVNAGVTGQSLNEFIYVWRRAEPVRDRLLVALLPFRALAHGPVDRVAGLLGLLGRRQAKERAAQALGGDDATQDRQPLKVEVRGGGWFAGDLVGVDEVVVVVREVATEGERVGHRLAGASSASNAL